MGFDRWECQYCGSHEPDEIAGRPTLKCTKCGAPPNIAMQSLAAFEPRYMTGFSTTRTVNYASSISYSPILARRIRR